VPLSNVTEVNPLDNKLHEVTASTMTLQAQANSVPPENVNGAIVGGLFFNLIDVAQGYVADPAQVGFLKVVSRKTHTGAGPFDIELAQNGPSTTECRTGGAGGDYQLIITFANPISAVGGATVTSGTGTVSSFSANGAEVTVNLSGVTSSHIVVVTLTGVNDGTTTGTAVVTMPVLVGDTNGDGVVNSGDATQTRGRSGELTGTANFRSDVNADGTVNSGDAIIVRARSGTSLGP
jgi:hypothetical protein